MRILGFVVLGLGSGVAATGHGVAIGWVQDLVNYPGLYLFALAVIAVSAPTAAEAGLRSATFFTALCLAYYGWMTFALGFAGVGRYFYAWTALAVTAVPVIAVTVSWASRRRGILPGLVMGLAAAIPLADGPLRQLWLGYGRNVLPAGFQLHPVQAALDVVMAVVIAGVMPRDRHTRLYALLLAVPMCWVATSVIGAARGSLGV